MSSVNIEDRATHVNPAAIGGIVVYRTSYPAGEVIGDRAHAATCDICYREIGTSEYVSHRNMYGYTRHICADCVNRAHESTGEVFNGVADLDGYHKCVICGDVVPDTECEATADGDYICETCAENDAAYRAGYEHCEHCGYWAQDLQTVNTGDCAGDTERWCADCVENDAVECDECGELWSEDAIVCTDAYDHDGNRVVMNLCPDCISDHYYTCSNCNDLVHEDAVEWSDDDDPLCPDCYGELCSKKLKPYGKTYATHFFDAGGYDRCASAGLYMGVELETEATATCDPEALAERLCDAVGDDKIECKYDGSLTYGCEIATQPMSPSYHLSADFSPWTKVIDVCRAEGATSYDNGECGLHIHLSREFFERDGVARSTYEYVLSRLMTLYCDQWKAFSRRKDFGWCRIEPISERPRVTTETLWDAVDKWHEPGTRYAAINTANSHTIEWRLCRGSLNPETIRATLEMAAGLAIAARDYALDGRNPDCDTWEGLISGIRLSLKRWNLPHSDLDAYLERRHIAAAAD